MTEEERVVRPFIDVLRDLRKGVLHMELSERLAEVVEGVELTGKPGKLVLTLAVKPTGSDSVTVADDVKAVVPEPARQPTLMFARDGVLTRNHPDQATLFPEGRPRVVSPSTGEVTGGEETGS